MKFPENSCDVIWEFAGKKLPVLIVQAPAEGANAQVTIAGAMANAESLAELVLIQLIN
ncbi:MAG TPA: hypothetical protein ENI15_09880 [Spirochaetes bacterium]|nr:hypothetical protein [Spirochaetota bacterium]